MNTSMFDEACSRYEGNVRCI